MPSRKPRSIPPSQTPPGGQGLLGGLGDLVARLAALAEAAQEAAQAGANERSGEFTIQGLEGRAQGVYGFSIRTGLGGETRVAPFGNLRPTENGAEVVDIREPLVDVFDEGDELVVVAELPGVTADEISVTLNGDVLAIRTQGARHFAREVLLPVMVDAAQLRQTYHNGILELRVSKPNVTDDPAQETP
jgi:HSP20 family protein